MVRYKLISIVVLVGLLLVQFFGSTGISARAQEIQPAGPTPPFKEPFPVEREVPVSGTTLDVNAIDASSVYTNVLGTGDGSIHGLIYRDGFLWACTRTSPARVLKISPESLLVVSRATLAYSYAEDIVAVDYDEDGNYYLWVVLWTVPARLVRVNPVDMTTVVHPLTGMDYGTAIWYAFNKLWVGGRDNIAEVNISNPDSISFVVHDFSGLRLWDNVVTASIRADLSYLYAAFLQRDTRPGGDGYTGTTIARIDPANPTLNPLPQYVVSDHPDDMVFTNDNLYTSGEDFPDPSVAYSFPISLTSYITETIADSASYGVFYTPTDPGNLWGAYIGEPGVIKKFDLTLDPVWSFNLPQGFDDPSEIAFDETGNMYVSTWQNGSGMIRYTIPDAVTLSISKSGDDAVLSWTNSDSYVHHFEIWRSTDPYFTPGTGVSTPYDIVTATVGLMSYTDFGVLQDVGNNYFYMVRAFNNYGLLGQFSNRVGEIGYALNNGVGKYSLIAIPFPTTITLASNLADYIGIVFALLKWNPATGLFRIFQPPSTGDNFSVSQGDVIFVYIVSPGNSFVSFVGDVVPHQYSLTPGKYNFISIPLQRSDLIDAKTTASDITNVITMLSWNEVFQSFRIFFPPNSGDNFSLRVGSPFIIDLGTNGPTDWP